MGKTFIGEFAFITTAAGICMIAASPAQANINDTYICDRNDGRSMQVSILAMEAGQAQLQLESADGRETELVRLVGSWEGNTFSYINGGSVFEGRGSVATLDHQRASFHCFMPIPNELAQDGMPQDPFIVLDGEGLTVMRFDDYHHIRVDFGMAEAEAIAQLDDYLGTPEASQALAECPAGALSYQNFAGLSLSIQDGNVAGWNMERDGSANPIRIALPWDGAQLGDEADHLPDWMEPMPQSTLGNEFYGDGVHAVLREDSDRIGYIWAGAACTFR